MNRVIKLRAWDGHEMINEKAIEGTFGFLCSGEILKRYETVMQFIGLQDKSKVDIYEGDIIAYDFEDNTTYGVIVYQGAEFKINHFSLTDSFRNFISIGEFEKENIIAIGNIFQNKELLNNE